MLIHNQAVKELAPADYLVIEKEHKLLEKYLSNLLHACTCSNLDESPDCQPCDQEKQASCQGRLPSFLFHIIELASRHFDDEETIMLSRPHITEQYEYFHAHQQAHTNIMQKLHVLVDECLSLDHQNNIAVIYIQFHKTLSNLFEEHDHLFDNPFIKSTKTQVT
jgi:hemerythrin